MQRLFSVGLILILLLNVLGYYGIIWGIQFQNDAAMSRRLDSDRYDNSQTITIKVPMSVPYMTDNQDFERVDGQFEHNGEYYRLIKQKYAHDTLTVICLKDVENKLIHQALSNYVKTFSDKPVGQHQNIKITFSIIKEYIAHVLTVKSSSPGWQSDVAHSAAFADLTPTFEPSIVHPPERG